MQTRENEVGGLSIGSLGFVIQINCLAKGGGLLNEKESLLEGTQILSLKKL